MLHEFLTANRDDLIERCRAKAALRHSPKATEAELEHGIPLFLDQLIKTLRMEQTPEPLESRKISGPAGGDALVSSEVGETAARHGRELWTHGFTIDQVVHDYGDLCQAVTDLAFESKAPIETDEFRTLNRCLDNAIADAVTAFSHQHDVVVADEHARAMNERLGFFAHELRNHLATATLALKIIKDGNVGLNGATGAVLDRGLIGIRNLVDRSLAEVRMTAGTPVRHQVFSVADFITEVKFAASLEAELLGCHLTVSTVAPQLAVEADRDLLFSAVGNLLQNAFKFTRPHTEVHLNTYEYGERILIDVEDHCGGLPAGSIESMFQPFTQSSENRSGLGLGLSIVRRSVEANGGLLSVRDVPGTGCVFTIDLPRCSMPRVPPQREMG